VKDLGAQFRAKNRGEQPTRQCCEKRRGKAQETLMSKIKKPLAESIRWDQKGGKVRCPQSKKEGNNQGLYGFEKKGLGGRKDPCLVSGNKKERAARVERQQEGKVKNN